MIVFTVNGTAAPQGSKNAIPFKNGEGQLRVNLVESSKKVKPWRQRIAAQAVNAMRRYGATMYVDQAVRVHLRFILPRPASAPKRTTPPAIKRNGDIDKLSRAVLDAITGVVIEDDCLVVELRATKRIAEIGEQARVVVAVSTYP